MVLDLPAEIWGLILANIKHIPKADLKPAAEERPGRYATLSNLCLVSKAFKTAAEPVLYREFTPRYGHSLVWWAHTVLLNRHLANHVVQVEFEPSEDIHECHFVPYDAFYRFFFDLARALGIIDGNTKFPLSDSDEHRTHFRSRIWLLLQVLCFRLPNLEKLMLYTSGLPPFPQFWKNSRLPPPNLRELRIEWSDMLENCSIASEDNENRADIADLGGLLALPKLERLNLCHFFGDIVRDEPLRNRTEAFKIHRNENLRWLRCSNSLFDRQVLHAIAAAFPNLETFEYLPGSLGNFQENTDAISGPEAVDALMPIAAKLRSMSFGFGYEIPMSRPLPGSGFWIPSLTAFMQLEELTIDMILLLKPSKDQLSDETEYTLEITRSNAEGSSNAFFEYFPPSLKSLKIIQVDSRLTTQLATLSANVGSWLPNLQEIQLYFALGTINDQDLMKRLKKDYAGEKMVDIEGWDVPLRFVNKTILKDGWRYTCARIDTAYLPSEWQGIMRSFTFANVRVRFGHLVRFPDYKILVDGAYRTREAFESWIDLEKPFTVTNLDYTGKLAVWDWMPSYQLI